MKKIGVLLAGCGYLDGAEINESVFTLLALSNKNVTANNSGRFKYRSKVSPSPSHV